MTRWWTYAMLAVAIVLGSIAKPDAGPRSRTRTEIVEAAHLSTNGLRKRTGKQIQTARRQASGFEPIAVLPDGIDLPPQRPHVLESHVAIIARSEPVVVSSSARAPPV